MAARRCSICSINWPTNELKCRYCGGKTWFLNNDDPDSPIPPPPVIPAVNVDLEREKVVKWRYETLVAEGCPEEIASAIAVNGSDVHNVMRTRELGASWDQIARIHT